MLTQSLPFDAAHADETLRQLPARQAVYALFGVGDAEPYIGATPNLRRRLERLLRPAKTQTRRLQLVSRIRRIEWQPTGSEFESLLEQFCLLKKTYGPKALVRMHLRSPAFVRFHGSNLYPRLTVTNRVDRISQREAQWLYGPFPSRAAAERYSEELLKLFLLRRCEENLEPNPTHPGCIYSEIKMCLAPCYQGCTDARYAEEAEAVRSFLATRGESKLITIRQQRDRASEQLDFESAAALHAQLKSVEAVRALAPELVHPLSELRALILQPSANPDEVLVFLFQENELRGPAAFSTLGMRIQNEQSGSSSLFAQPMALLPVPEGGGQSEILGEAVRGEKVHRDVLESRLEAALASLHAARLQSSTERQGHLALLTRWYYRPQQKRIGEIFFCSPVADAGSWPIKGILRGIGRVYAQGMEKNHAGV